MQPKEISYGCIAVHRSQDGDRFLLVKQRTHWSFPKGHLEVGEDPQACAKRELFEETGISDIEIVPDVSFHEEYVFDRNGIATKKENIFFLCFVDKEVSRPQEGEIVECRFVSFDEAMNIFEFEAAKRILSEVVEILNR